MYASLQFCGNIEEYFSTHSEKFVVFIVMPRLKNSSNLLRVYFRGKLIEEKTVTLSENIFLYYFLWHYNHWKILLKYFSYHEKFYVVTGHPVSFFGLFLQRIIRHRARFIYWMGDYFPGDGFVIRIFERVKKFYHDRADYNLYLSDGINQVLNNGKTTNNNKKKTVMWGVKPVSTSKKTSLKGFNILFVGLIKKSQGLQTVFELLSKDKLLNISILGICDKPLYKEYMKLIKSYKIIERVYFPNKFFSDEKLIEFAQKCHVGVAMYDTDKTNPTYYTDPGKVKTYTQLNLPVIMTNTSGVAAYIKKYQAGEVIDSNEISGAITKIKNNYDKYLRGVIRFNNYFDMNKYYKEKFRFIESIK